VPQQPEPETRIPEPSAKTEAEAPASGPSDTGDTGGAVDATELMERIRKEWINLRQSVGERNKVAEIMLTEATPLGMDGTTLVVGHNTGALANSINSKHNNDDIVAVLTDKLGTEVAVRCVVGTDPKAAGFEAPARAPQAWSPPSAPKQSEEQGPEHTSPSDDEADSGDEDPHAADGNEPDEPTPTSDGSVSSENEAVTPEPEAAPVPYDPWASTPAKTVNPENSGAEAQQAPAASSPELSPQPAPAQPEAPAPEASGPAAAAAAAAAAAGAAGVVRGAAPRATPDPTDGPNTGFGESTSFSSGVPLPPEPEDEPPMEEEPAPYTREDEERDMVDQSQEAGTFDRRSPTEVAMELLADELGARPL